MFRVLQKALNPRKKRKLTHPTRASIQKRLDKKKRLGDKKRLRSQRRFE
jgi:hypothetical protein